jgi:hypothetical protein
MTAPEFTVISLSALDRIFHEKSLGEIFVFDNVQCVLCGQSFNIKIQKTSGGYGFLGGIISEPLKGQFLFKCCNCNGFEGKKDLSV